jgi:ParB-like chromosome segregation protein Spo0J
VSTWPIDRVIVEDRYRKDLRDINALAESIEANNGVLLQPIIVRSSGHLVAGARRLAACKQLGRGEVEVYVRDDLDSVVAQIIAERDENTCREPFTPSEAVALGRDLEKLEQPKAAARERAGKKIEPSGKFPEGKGDTRDKVGPAVGMSGRNYSKAKKVVVEAEAGNPIAVEALEEMDKTGKVEGPYRKVIGKPSPSRNGGTKERPIYSFDTEKGKQVAAKAKSRLENVIFGIEGYAESVAHLRVEHALPAASDEDRERWVRSLTESVRNLGEFKRQLKQECENNG